MSLVVTNAKSIYFDYIQTQNLLLNLWYHFVGSLDNFFNSAIIFLSGILHCALIVCTFLGNFKSFWKYSSMSVLIIITMLTNNSSIFCSSLKFFHFHLLSGDGGTTTWPIFMCYLFCFSFCWWHLIGRFILGTVFSFQICLPTLNSFFVILFHFHERKEAQQVCQLSRCYWESPILNRFHWI